MQGGREGEEQKFSLGHIAMSFPLDIPVKMLSGELNMTLDFKEEMEWRYKFGN